MMKRLICIFSIIGLLLVISSCAEKTPPSIVGTWEYSNHSELKEYLTDQIDDSYFYKVYYQFNEDGTGSTWIDANPDQKLLFTYTFDGEILSVTLHNGSVQKLECEFHGTHFYVSDGKEDMKFEKVKSHDLRLSRRLEEPYKGQLQTKPLKGRRKGLPTAFLSPATPTKGVLLMPSYSCYP